MDDIHQLKARETHQNWKLAMLGLIFDQYTDAESHYLERVVELYGTDRIYHISLSPFGYTSNQVYRGAYDAAYKRFFQDIKDLDIQVVFRTMHEMNWGWYSRSSQPWSFQLAWRRVVRLAREEFALDKTKLLFSLSFNSQDLPTSDTLPTQSSEIFFCSDRYKTYKTRCPQMQDYWPWDAYVDLVGVTLYNRGHSRADERSVWKNPLELLQEDDLYARLLSRGKPIVIDELGSSGAYVSGQWSPEALVQAIASQPDIKNTRIRERKHIFLTHPNIVGVVYFNVDDTLGGQDLTHGEADRSIILSQFLPQYLAAPGFLLKYGDETLHKMFKLNAPDWE